MTQSSTAAATPFAAALSGLESLSAKLVALRAALAAAAAANWRDPTADLIAADDVALLITQALADIGCPGAAAALDVETLIAKLAPSAIPALQWLIVSGPLHGAIPGASAEDGGYPAGANGGRIGPRPK